MSDLQMGLLLTIGAVVVEAAILSFRFDENGYHKGKYTPPSAYLALFVFVWGMLAMEPAAIEWMRPNSFGYFAYASLTLGLGLTATAFCTFLWWKLWEGLSQLNKHIARHRPFVGK